MTATAVTAVDMPDATCDELRVLIGLPGTEPPAENRMWTPENDRATVLAVIEEMLGDVDQRDALVLRLDEVHDGIDLVMRWAQDCQAIEYCERSECGDELDFESIQAGDGLCCSCAESVDDDGSEATIRDDRHLAAFDAIVGVLDGTEWDASTAEEVAEIVRRAGVEIREPQAARPRWCRPCAEGLGDDEVRHACGASHSDMDPR